MVGEGEGGSFVGNSDYEHVNERYSGGRITDVSGDYVFLHCLK